MSLAKLCMIGLELVSSTSEHKWERTAGAIDRLVSSDEGVWPVGVSVSVSVGVAWCFKNWTPTRSRMRQRREQSFKRGAVELWGERGWE